MFERGTIRCLVSGHVQGVFYRAATRERAASLGLDGWVRNLPDGRVELVVAGAPGAIESLVAWLWQGPPAAVVTGVAVEPGPVAVEQGFSVVA